MSQTIIKKKAIKKGELPSFPIVPYAQLRNIRLFRDVPEKALLKLDQKVRLANANANETVLELSSYVEGFGHFFFVMKGQIKITGFDENAKKRTLNFLRKGEFFVDKTFSWRNLVATRITAITQCELFIIEHDHLKEFASEVGNFEEQLTQIAKHIDHRNRIFCEDQYSRSVLDFLVDHSLTQASRIKITQMDKCIECNTCYDECADRHGFVRLERGYANFGVLDVAKSCLTCFYPTCIPSCPVDSVIYNNEKGEVEILDDCIGCQACKTACTYGAISIVKVNPKDKHFARFLAPDRKIKPKFIADKCNHCYGYEDMACISNCPTGAIIELSSKELLDNPTIFGVTEHHRKPLDKLNENSDLLDKFQNAYLILCAFITIAICYEFIAQKIGFQFSFFQWIKTTGLIKENISLTFDKGSDLTLFLGNLGFTFIVLSMSYPLRKAFPTLFQNLGPKLFWLDLHNLFGYLGSLLVLFHTGFEFNMHFGTFGMMALSLVMLTGIFGRFLYQAIPRGVAGTELKMKDIEEQDQELTRKLDIIFINNAAAYQKVIDEIIAKTTVGLVDKPTLYGFFKSTVIAQILLWKLKIQLPNELKPFQRQMDTFYDLAKEKIRIKRNVAFLAFSSKLFVKWQYVHKPLAYVMGVLAILHVIYNLLFFRWNA